MNQNLFEKLTAAHLVSGEMTAGCEVGIRVDQTLTQDSLGAMAYLQFEAMGLDRVKTELSVSYVDHLMLQVGEGNGDIHRYLETVADRIGVIYSKAGNGICHQVHLERFARPGKALIGSDSHTVTAGAMGMLAFGAGGLNVALAMGGEPFYFTYPKVIRVNLEGTLQPWVSAKDVALEVLKQIGTTGNVGTVLEYAGSGLAALSVPQRATIANMGAESGVSASVFPSDEVTRTFLRAENREEEWTEWKADSGAVYAGELTIDLSRVRPNVALPHSPDKVVRVADVPALKVNQVLIGSCTNASYQDLMRAAAILKGHKVHPDVSLGVVAGSRQVMSMLAANGALSWIIDAGGRILESGCSFCVGQGQAPELGAVSVRTNNRNYKGRSGTQDAQVYLVSPETAAITAITGVLTDPASLGNEEPEVPVPARMPVDDGLLLFPTGRKTIYRSRLIGSPPFNTPMPETLDMEVAIKVGNLINTDDIIPGGATMSLRANIQESCQYVFHYLDGAFPSRCKAIRERELASLIVAGEGYGQGSSREHAALCPMAMGVRCVAAKSIERIHQDNLINFGILPLLFEREEDYEDLQPGDRLTIRDVRAAIWKPVVILENRSRGRIYRLSNLTNARQRQTVLCGGRLNLR